MLALDLIDGLAHFLEFCAPQAEAFKWNHRFLGDLEGAHAALAVQVKIPGADFVETRSPIVAATVSEKLIDGCFRSLGWADGVASGNGDPRNDAVGNGSAASSGQEVVLIGLGGEGCKRFDE